MSVDPGTRAARNVAMHLLGQRLKGISIPHPYPSYSTYQTPAHLKLVSFPLQGAFISIGNSPSSLILLYLTQKKMTLSISIYVRHNAPKEDPEDDISSMKHKRIQVMKYW